MDYPATVELRDEITAALPDSVVTTISYAAASSAVNSGKVCALLTPPRSDFTTRHAAESEYRIVLCSGQDDEATAFDQMTELIPLLVHALDVTAARPAAFQPQQGPLLNAYELTLTRSYNI